MLRLTLLTILFIILQSYLYAKDYSIDASSLHKELRSGHLKMGSPGPKGKEILITNQYLTLGGNHPVYQYYVDRLFKEISVQLNSLYSKEGGPVIGIQLENEYRVGPARKVGRNMYKMRYENK
jgi:hypothetical protein